MHKEIIVAIDGPAGAGKSSVSRALADRLGYTYIDTGAMYRAVALIAQRQEISWDDDASLGQLALNLTFEFITQEHQQHLLVNGEDVTGLIRTPEISHGASMVAKEPSVVKALTVQAQKLGSQGGIVMEGRQVGTQVFPAAEVKIYLTATPEERARRRLKEHEARDEQVNFDEIVAAIKDRDKRDMERAYGPLRKAGDAIEVLTDGITQEQVIDKLEQIVVERIRTVAA